MKLPALGIVVVLAAAPLWGQPTPAFEVASIKPSEPITAAMVQSGKLHVGMRIDGARVDIGNFRLLQLIMKAYDVKMYQVQGPPFLTSGQAFDIVANLPEGATKEQVPAMLQKLLADRFKLKVRIENEQRPVYAMVVAEGGAKLKSTSTADETGQTAGVSGSSTASVNINKGGGGTVSDGAGHKQTVTPTPDGKYLHFDSSGLTMDELADGLSPLTEEPIVNATNLKGKYDVAFDISMAEVMEVQRRFGGPGAQAAAGAADPSKAPEASEPGGSIFTALKAMGLKLERRKEPMKRIIVEQCEKMPSDN